ncbi:hypothetical protein PGT21_014646 [Puccinia graminis f. sp. tritici]|uniref:Hydrophobin n=1 Tax=Puccinia graminis f. sp. tritici TaxID=56615 RepID=A0A5B0PT75_PUCGR|nr:hypothetical protein PGT21_014646 [Puccinia graminis f. sp. tritici]KAA1104985.1 hypothetical protein PGTUg99_016444 [Puccinia graminis f. sp. tritici]
MLSFNLMPIVLAILLQGQAIMVQGFECGASARPVGVCRIHRPPTPQPGPGSGGSTGPGGGPGEHHGVPKIYIDLKPAHHSNNNNFACTGPTTGPNRVHLYCCPRNKNTYDIKNLALTTFLYHYGCEEI